MSGRRRNTSSPLSTAAITASLLLHSNSCGQQRQLRWRLAATESWRLAVAPAASVWPASIDLAQEHVRDVIRGARGIAIRAIAEDGYRRARFRKAIQMRAVTGGRAAVIPVLHATISRSHTARDRSQRLAVVEFATVGISAITAALPPWD